MLRNNQTVPTAKNVEEEPHQLRFPPFPPPPPGVTIVPFTDFVEHGIRVFDARAGMEVEVDNLDIPTVELRVKHDTDVCKSNVTRRRNNVAGEAVAIKKKRKEWYEVWADGEQHRGSGTYHPNQSDIERLHQAAVDFKKSRIWPAQTTGISELWDQFRIFSGLLNNSSMWRKTKPDKKSAQDDDDDSFSDDEQDGPDSRDVRPQPANGTQAQTTPVRNEEPMVLDLMEDTNRQVDKVVTFLNDPEVSMKIFLSSFMRDQGLVWSDRNLVYIPQLVSFFINFVIRNRALPEHERGLRRATDVIQLAQRELPLTSAIAKALPGDFSRACEKLWGRLSGGFEPLVDTNETTQSEISTSKKNGHHQTPASNNAEEEEVKQLQAEIRAADPSLLLPDDGPDLVKQVIEDNVGDDVHLSPSTNGWGVDNGAADTWGKVDGGTSSGTTWGTDGESAAAWGGETTQGIWDAPDVSGWEDASPSIMDILGPTALPLTHDTGVVEWSMRRIKAVTRAPTTPSDGRRQPAESDEPNAQAVEAVLDASFAKVVLEPWHGWDPSGTQELAQPKILPKSRGAAIVGDADAASTASTTQGGSKKIHNAMTDDITVLVPESAVDVLSIGMGLGATWIEIARREGEEAKEAVQNGKKKSKKRFWYMEQLMVVLPSYYTVSPTD